MRIFMWLGIAFLAAAIALGLRVSRRFDDRQPLADHLAVAIALGLGTGALLTFLLSFAMGSLSPTAILLGSVILAAGAMAIAPNVAKKTPPQPAGKRNRFSLSIAVATALFLVLAYFNYLTFTVAPTGAISSIQNAWGDYPLHLSLVNSFALRDNFPPAYPNLQGAVMRYPFLFDFLSAILVRGGFSLQLAVLLPNLLALFSLIFLARKLSGKILEHKELAISAALLFFFLNGNFAFLYQLPDAGTPSAWGAWFSHLPELTKAPDKKIEFLNLSYAVFLPQRTMLLGFALALLAYFILYRVLLKESQQTDYWILALLLLVLPLVHISSFAIVAITAAFVFGIRTLSEHRLDPSWMPAALVAALGVIPQLVWINQQPRMADFFGKSVGWLARTNETVPWAWFWIQNTGFLLPLALLGFIWIEDKRVRMFYLPFLAVFLAANLIRFQPWDWDNVKYFSHWLFFTALFAGQAMEGIWIRMKGNAAKYKARWDTRKIAATMITGGVILVTISSGLLTLIYWNGTQHELFSAQDVTMARYIEQNTPANAIFLTAAKHNHFVYALAGRQIIMGYEGHLWSHGLSYDWQKQMTDAVLVKGEIAKAEGVDYIVVSPFETEANPQLAQQLNQSGIFRAVYTLESGGRKYQLFQRI